MAEQELNLLQFAAAGMAQLGAGSPQVVRRDALQSRSLAAALHHIPDHVLRDSLTPNLARPAHRTKNLSLRDSGGHRPLVECVFRPRRYRNGANVPALADQVHDSPVLLPLLHVAHLQPDQLRSAEPATKEQCEHGIVTLVAKAITAGAAQYVCALLQT